MEKAAHRYTAWLEDNHLRRFLDRFTPPDSVVLVLSAAAVGVSAGAGAVIFVYLLDAVRAFTTMVQGYLGEIAGLFLLMAASGLMVGYIVNHWAKEVKGRGIPEVMEAVALHGGRIRPRVAPVKMLASSLTIGVGGSAGREGPIVYIGSALGSTLGQILHFSQDRTRTLVACGAAAGVAATFNAPIAGTIFALEVILGEFTTRYFGAVVLSSVTASIVARVYLGEEAAFRVPAYPVTHLEEYGIYTALGILAALVAILFIRVLYRVEGFFNAWRFPVVLKASLGMILTAVVALSLPDRLVLGPGLTFIGEMIAGDFQMPLGLMVALLLGKLAATSLTLGSGNSGGVFAPGLYIGALLGGIVGNVAHTLWPHIVVDPGAYAIVGMAAVFAGAARAPITAVLIVFEMSNDYKLILPLMLATVLSTILAEHLHRESMYTLKLKMKGITLQRGRDLDLMQSLRVHEAMTPDPYVVPQDMPVRELARIFEQTHSHSFPVVDDNLLLVGMVSIRDYERVLNKPDIDDLTIADIAYMESLLVAYEDEPLSTTLQRLGTRGINKIPVLARHDERKVVGVIRRRDIVKAYNMALARRADREMGEDKAKLRRVSGVNLVEITVPDQSKAAHKTIAELAPNLPYECVIVSIRRQDNLLIPHGDTTLQPGDLVNALVSTGEESCFAQLFAE